MPRLNHTLPKTVYRATWLRHSCDVSPLRASNASRSLRVVDVHFAIAASSLLPANSLLLVLENTRRANADPLEGHLQRVLIRSD
jgi:hypothetical protein